MTWTLIDTPSPEELAWGYTPAPNFSTYQTGPLSGEAGEMRRYFVTLFAAFAMLVGLQNLMVDHPADGQRRLAEVNLSERKTECRGCESIIAFKPEPDL